MFNQFVKTITGVLLAAGVSMTPAIAGEVEVLHWWTSGGEAKSVAVLKDLLEKEGHKWGDFAVAGGGGENAMTVLKSRVMSGDAPTAAQIKGPSIQEWGAEGVLANLDPVANAAGWDSLLPSQVIEPMKYKGHYVAAPVNVHRVNWLWANPEVFRKAGAEIPTSWEQFAESAAKIKAAGFIPVAHGGQAWQDTTVFEAIVLGLGGPKFFNRAFVDHDQATLRSATMVKAFKTFRTYQSFTDKDAAGRDWNLATSMVIKGEAAMQIMGDWAKGEFKAAGKTPGVDYVCVAAPGTSGTFTFNIDSFAMFQMSGDDSNKAQQAMARLIMEPKFQEVFNVNKGSIPARLGMSRVPFDSCAHASMDAFQASASSGGLVPSMAHGMSTYAAQQGAIYDVVTKFFNTPGMSASAATKDMAAAIKASM